MDPLAQLRRAPNAFATWQKALIDLNNGRHASALAGYQNLVRQFPNVPQLWAEMGLAAAGDLEFAAADGAFQRALELAPNDAGLLVFIGTQYYHLRQLDRAFACLKGAVEADPSSAQARLTLAVWQERTRRLDEAWESVETCLARYPKDGQALYLKAFFLHRKGNNAAAETALRDLLDNTQSLSADIQSNANHLLGVILDGLGNYSEALSCLSKAKALRRKLIGVPALEKIYEKVHKAGRELLAELTPDTIRRWRGEAAASPAPHPLALLAGAARSGTTLIGQIVGAHPDILIFDETYSFEKEVVKNISPAQGESASLKSLNDLSAENRAPLIARYFKSLLRETNENPAGKLFFDKNPGTTAALPLWLRLFPESKVIIALRDPLDVVVSCYFQNFPVGWSMVGFLSWEGTARYYSDTMDVWLRLRDLGGFDWIETRYEDVVNNLEGEGRRVTNFLGLPWHEAQAKYYDKARSKFVHSPTYNEVTKPVHNRAVGRWQHYAEALAPFQEPLAKYRRAFGYG